MESTADMAEKYAMVLFECCVLCRGFDGVSGRFCGVQSFDLGDATA